MVTRAEWDKWKQSLQNDAAVFKLTLSLLFSKSKNQNQIEKEGMKSIPARGVYKSNESGVKWR